MTIVFRNSVFVAQEPTEADQKMFYQMKGTHARHVSEGRPRSMDGPCDSAKAARKPKPILGLISEPKDDT